MWINRKVYDRIVLDSEKRNAVCIEQARQVATLTATLDWLRVRVSQLEIERAQLIYNYMGVKVPTPSIEMERTPSPSASALNTLPSFEDIGDEEAARLGIGWNEHGEIVPLNRK